MSEQRVIDLSGDVEGAFQRTEKDRQEIPTEQVYKNNNLDLHDSTSIVLGNFLVFWAYYDQLVALIDIKRDRLDKLLDRTKALTHAQANCRIPVLNPDVVRPLDEEVSKLRGLYELVVRALMLEGFMSKDSLKDFSGANGYKNKATDLHLLANSLEASQPAVKRSRFSVTVDELRHAQDLSVQLQGVVAQRDLSPEIIAQNNDTLLRCFTLFMQSYDELRRGITYLRWHYGDADEIAPSLYSGRGHAKSKAKAEEPVAVVPVETKPEPTTEDGKKLPFGSQGGSPFSE